MHEYGVSFGTSARGGERLAGTVFRRAPRAMLRASDDAELLDAASPLSVLDDASLAVVPAPGITTRVIAQEDTGHGSADETRVLPTVHLSHAPNNASNGFLESDERANLW